MKHKNEVYGIMRSRIVQLSVNPFGCRVIQKTLDTFKHDDVKINEILAELKAQISTVLNNKNGNHVI